MVEVVVLGLKEEVIEVIKNLNNSEVLVDEEFLESLLKKRFEISTNHIVLARLFVNCYEVLSSVVPKLKKEEENKCDCSKELSEFIKGYSSNADVLRVLLSSYNDGNSVGDYCLKLRIEKNVVENREKYSKLINTFFQIFGGD